ncbi:MAG TPA: NUDIX hydrolase [Actinomycetota bacterium]|jgi:8-oxo-dGTP diphosphatase|nr:NUDIX hydrolase [Actinomycetota bacterium]
MARELIGPPIRAAGGVLWRSAGEKNGGPLIEVAVIHRPRYDDWSLPKGKLAPGESEVEGAIREVFEETGHRVRLGQPLGEARYTKTSGGAVRPKVVRYWSMEAEAGVFVPGREVDDLRWVSLAEAADMLTHPRDRELLERFVRGPSLGGCVLLVRHASAGERSEWEGDDRLRPLDPLGWAQAEELVRLLSHFEVGDIVSADFIRCVQTVQPLSEAIRVPIREEPLWSEVGYPGNEEKALTALRRWGASGRTTVVSSQGDVIPDLLERVASSDDLDLRKGGTKKASVWALMFDGDSVFSAEYFPAPRVQA